MPIGPGKYDDECTNVRERTAAAAAVVIVVGGTKGGGFSVQGDPATLLALPNILERVAAQMRESLR